MGEFDAHIDSGLQTLCGNSPLEGPAPLIRHLPQLYGGLGVTRLGLSNPVSFAASILRAAPHIPNCAPHTFQYCVDFPHLFHHIWEGVAQTGASWVQSAELEDGSRACIPDCWMSEELSQPPRASSFLEVEHIRVRDRLEELFPYTSVVGKLLRDFTFKGSGQIARENGKLEINDPNRLSPMDFVGHLRSRLLMNFMVAGRCPRCEEVVPEGDVTAHCHARCASRDHFPLRKALSQLFGDLIAQTLGLTVLFREEEFGHIFDLKVELEGEAWLLDFQLGFSIDVRHTTAPRAVLARRWAPYLADARSEGCTMQYKALFISPGGRVCPATKVFLSSISKAGGTPVRELLKRVRVVEARYSAKHAKP